MAESGVGGSVLTWTLEDGVLTISGEGAMTNYTFESAPPWEMRKLEITTVVVEEGVTSIGSKAFSNCVNLSTASLPEGIEKIGDESFSCCNNLKEIELPEGLEWIGNHAFSDNISLKRIEIPDTVTYIGEYAFKYCCCITEIEIPEKVTCIESGSISICFGLKQITLPCGITEIKHDAFWESNALTDVYFEGTQAQAQAIVIGSNNNYIGSALWHCSDGELDGVGATEGICGSSMQWDFDGSGLTISGDGEMGEFDELNPAPWTAYKESTPS